MEKVVVAYQVQKTEIHCLPRALQSTGDRQFPEVEPPVCSPVDPSDRSCHAEEEAEVPAADDFLLLLSTADCRDHQLLLLLPHQGPKQGWRKL